MCYYFSVEKTEAPRGSVVTVSGFESRKLNVSFMFYSSQLLELRSRKISV
jgi:hypothetical protein